MAVDGAVRGAGRGAIGVALVGTGLAGGMHAAGLRETPRARLLGAVGTSRERSAAFAARWSLPRTYPDIDAALADPEVVAVHLCTPPHTHPALTERIAAAGRHVLVDKPLARTVAEADAMIASCDRHGVILAGLFQHRFIPICRRVHEAVRAGRLGRVHLADCYVKWWRDDAYYSASSWRARRATEGGGSLINQAIHSVDLLQWLVGPVVSVSGHTATAAHAIETEDVGIAVLRTADGALGVLEGTTAAFPGFPERIELHGDRGSVVLNEGQRRLEWFLRDDAPRVEEEGRRQGNAADPAAVSPEAHAAAFADFLDAVASGGRPAVDGAEARKALEIVEAVYRSAAAGGAPVRLPLSGTDRGAAAPA